eukprot:TRINITY_DN110164_c0_g1_i1.p2 TRINITY_DN110164_c0_g1~~TRINITY_DN110164_c0_g1_i1.p2  ORF type:complete len:170 (-),score=39.92 TRINITY_DN110164_c0_g1_i1:55-564(-)
MASSVLGKVAGGAAAVAGGAAAAAQAVAQKAMGSAEAKPPPPPPKVWCFFLRRVPVKTEEDEPEIQCCEKTMIKICTIPLALMTYLLGWLISLFIYAVGCCCCPVCGPAIFTAFATARLQSASEFGAKHAMDATQADAKRAVGGLACLLSFYKWVYWNMIRPLGLLCDW